MSHFNKTGSSDFVFSIQIFGVFFFFVIVRLNFNLLLFGLYVINSPNFKIGINKDLSQYYLSF